MKMGKRSVSLFFLVLIFVLYSRANFASESFCRFEVDNIDLEFQSISRSDFDNLNPSLYGDRSFQLRIICLKPRRVALMYRVKSNDTNAEPYLYINKVELDQTEVGVQFGFVKNLIDEPDLLVLSREFSPHLYLKYAGDMKEITRMLIDVDARFKYDKRNLRVGWPLFFSSSVEFQLVEY